MRSCACGNPAVTTILTVHGFACTRCAAEFYQGLVRAGATPRLPVVEDAPPPPIVIAPARRGRRAKISADDVVTIRHAYACGALQSELAAGYGVTDAAISHVVQRRTWRRVGDPGLRLIA